MMRHQAYWGTRRTGGHMMHLPDGTTLEIERELFDATPMFIIDLSWRYTDPNGHEHAWRQTNIGEAGPPAGDLPTLVWIVEQEGGEYFDEDGYECYAPEIGHYECVQCGAHVTPRTTANDQRYMVAGLTHYRINGEPATQEQVDALRAKWFPDDAA